MRDFGEYALIIHEMRFERRIRLKAPLVEFLGIEE